MSRGAADDVPVDLRAWTEGAKRRLRRAASARDSQGIADAVAMFRAAWAGVDAETDPNRAPGLINFASALLDEFEQTGLVSALSQAVDLLDRSEHVCPQGHPHRLSYLRALGRALLREAQRTGDHTTMHRAVAARRDSLRLAGRGHEWHGVCRLDLGVTLIHRHAVIGDQRDINEAVAILETMAKRPTGLVSRAAILSTLGNARLARFLRTGGRDRADLSESVKAHTAAVNSTGADDPQAGMYLSDLGTALMRQYEHTGDVAGLKAAVARHREAVQVTVPGHAEEAVRLANLAFALVALHEHTQDLAVLDEAIRTFRAAVKATFEDHAYYARYLYGLAAALFRRGELMGVLFDFDESAVLAEKAYEATPQTHPDRPTRLALFAHAVANRGGISSLCNADEKLQQAIDLLPRDSPARVMLQSNQGTILTARGQHAASLRPAQARQDLENAVRLTRGAVDSTPVDHSEYAGRLLNLALASVSLAQQTTDARILDEPIRLCTANRSESGAGSADLPLVLARASILACRYDLTKDEQALADALAAYRLAIDLPDVPTGQRLSAAYDGGHLGARSGNVDVAVELFTHAVNLMGTVIWRGMHRRDQERLLRGYGALPSDAAAMAIEAGRWEHAVELLEQGRSVLLDWRIDDDADLGIVRAHGAGLADRFERVRARLDQVVIPDVEADIVDLPNRPPHQPSPVDLRSELALELDQVIEEIRSLPGHQDLFRPRKLADLRAAFDQGPIVVVNVSTYRCDALTITPARIGITPLAAVTSDDIQRHAHFFLNDAAKASRPDGIGRTAREEMTAALEWMWDTIVDPVMNDLGITTKAQSHHSRLHLYWCPTGLATFLPLHAAGHHAADHHPEPKTVIDRVGCSYIPKLRVLVPHHNGPGPTEQPPNDLLIVSMPETPGKPNLPNAVTEADYLLDSFPHATHLSGPSATIDAVTAALKTHSWVHFSVHGVTDKNTPVDGGLELHDGRLTIRKISALHLPKAKFAFLSACATYQGVPDIPDEGITLGTALRTAGYTHVIATLWPISDNHSTDIVQEIYDHLTSSHNGIARLRPQDAAHGLREAACDIRDKYPDQPHKWVPFIHTGPCPNWRSSAYTPQLRRSASGGGPSLAIELDIDARQDPGVL